MSGPLHDDEIAIDVSLVRALVDRAFPRWAALPLRRLNASGSTNALFRLGTDLLVRLPRQPGGSATIDKEARWLPVIAPALPVAVPEIVAVGQPDLSYPERWSIVRWLDGDVATALDPDGPPDPGRTDLAADLANLITALRRLDVPSDASSDDALRWYRGEPLAERDADTRAAIAACRRIPDLHLDLDAVERMWDDAMSSPDIDTASEPRWYHGDLAPENLLVNNGRLTAVLDFGGLSVGDPTVDLLPAWAVLDAPAREAFRTRLAVDDATWRRGRAWALSIALIAFPYYWHTMPARCAASRAMARAVLADAAGQGCHSRGSSG